MFVTFLKFLLLADALVLMLAVLLQSGKGGGLAASFGGASAGDALFGSRQAGNLLTKTTWWTAGIFLFIAFTMQMMSSRTAGPSSVLDQQFSQPPAPTQPTQSAPIGRPESGAAAPVLPLQALPTAPPAGSASTKKPPATTKKP